MENKEKKLEVGVKAFIEKDGKFLVLKRAKPYPGLTEPMWDIPGGRIHPGEPLSAALAREIEEETKMKLTDSSLIYAQDILRVEGQHTVRLTYRAQVEGDITLDPEEHTDHTWVSIEELSDLYHDAYLDPVIQILKGNA